MRAFLAVELPSHARHELARLQDQLRDSRADVKWVEKDNLHLTLRFLGDIDERERQRVESASQLAAAAMSPVTVTLSSLGAFPSVSAPRVVWVGLGDGAESLAQLAAQIEAQLAKAGFPKADKPFSAHITLGRVRSPRNRLELVRTINDVVWTPPASFVVDHVTLFRSDLGSAGPTYSILREFPFSGKSTG